MRRMLRHERQYLIRRHVGHAKGIFKDAAEKYWTWRIENMSEGEILRLYYQLTGKKNETR